MKLDLNKYSAKRQFILGFTLIIVFVLAFVFMRQWWSEGVPKLDNSWGKIGIFITMFGTIMTFYNFFVLEGYRRVKLELNREKTKLMNQKADAHFNNNEGDAGNFTTQIQKVDAQNEYLDRETQTMDKYGKLAVGFGIAALELGLVLQLFSS